ncbi:hypothetical protein F2Q68_00006421 [Brassica cretica]|uniref:Uncharacterized protein n=2 Tax=Brassica cretica TaxID=69181 RepID=A0ABQ7BYH7_BRACR|nr:hypothetical protein F2Q68_00006421 [Brassica cretica]KAF3544441.1 hypothetical protein DY000_02009889 [Brassica cretica]
MVTLSDYASWSSGLGVHPDCCELFFVDGGPFLTMAIRGPVGRRVSTATAAARGSWESDPPPRDNSDSGYTLKIHRQRTVLLVLDTRLQWLRIIGFGILVFNRSE